MCVCFWASFPRLVALRRLVRLQRYDNGPSGSCGTRGHTSDGGSERGSGVGTERRQCCPGRATMCMIIIIAASRVRVPGLPKFDTLDWFNRFLDG